MAEKKQIYEPEDESPGRLERLRIKIKELVHFFSYGIWRQNPETLSGKKNILYDAIKTVILTVRNVQELNIAASARSLTYRTLLSIVPLLAILFAIARGFGIENIMESSIFNFMLGNNHTEEVFVAAPGLRTDSTAIFSATPGPLGSGSTSIITGMQSPREIDSTGVIAGTTGLANLDSTKTIVTEAGSLDTIYAKSGEPAKLTPNFPTGISADDDASAEVRTSEFLHLLFKIINDSLEQAKGGGIFAGIGILLFLYTILILFNDIERNLNKIWQLGKGRGIGRKMTDYTAMVLFMPLFFIVVNALNIISYPQNDTLKEIYTLYPFIPRLLQIVPFVIMILLFTALYKFLPNTKVKFLNALIAGIVAGAAFQFFQMLYMSGQMWITRYNAIYGTFAAIPLMLLWIQMSWFIVLIGAEISYAAQNVRKFSFEKETRNISRRYRDFFTLMIASKIVQRFADEKPPLTADQISVRCKVPGRLTNDILDQLVELRILSVTPSLDDVHVPAFQPAMDINLITVERLITDLDEQGSEDFMIDINENIQKHWEALMDTRMGLCYKNKDIPLKDLWTPTSKKK